MAEESKDSSAVSGMGEMVQTQKSNGMSETDGCPSIETKVLFFVRSRELTGMSDISVEMPAGGTALDCITKLLPHFPKLEEIYNSIVLALNEEYNRESTVLRNRDEIEIIPTISGG